MPKSRQFVASCYTPPMIWFDLHLVYMTAVLTCSVKPSIWRHSHQNSRNSTLHFRNFPRVILQIQSIENSVCPRPRLSLSVGRTNGRLAFDTTTWRDGEGRKRLYRRSSTHWRSANDGVRWCWQLESAMDLYIISTGANDSGVHESAESHRVKQWGLLTKM